jgi:hypothetical protein
MSGYIKYPFLTGPQHNGHPNADGALLVVPSRYVDLDEQVRTRDKFHAGVVAKLQRREGMTMSDLQRYSILSEVDFRDPNSPWYTAPVIVPINRDRYNLIHVGAIRFARVNNTCVLRWRCIDKAYEQKPIEEYMDNVYKNDPCFWEYFVVGSPCSINTTINKRLNLVNAMKGTQFSLTMNSEEEQNDVDVALHLHPPGSVIDIPCPLAVNISFDGELFSNEQLRTLKQYSVIGNSSLNSPVYVSQEVPVPFPRRHNRILKVESENDSSSEDGDMSNGYVFVDRVSETESENESSSEDSDIRNAYVFVDKQGDKSSEKKKDNSVVVPILRCLSRTRKEIPGYGTKHSHPFKVTLQQRFPIDSDFAITVNRSQGQTLDNVILAISQREAQGCNFRYNSIYVAFSRVRETESIRLLLIGDTVPQKWMSVAYIPNLKPDPFCRAVLSGWSSLGGDDWQTNEWSCILTRRTYETGISRKRPYRNIV